MTPERMAEMRQCDVFARHVQHKLAEIEKAEARTEKPVAAE